MQQLARIPYGSSLSFIPRVPSMSRTELRYCLVSLSSRLCNLWNLDLHSPSIPDIAIAFEMSLVL